MSETAPSNPRGSFWRIAIVLTAFSVIGYVCWRSATATTEFSAQATVLLTKRIDQLKPVPDEDGVAMEGFVATYMVLLRSPSILDHAIKKNNLRIFGGDPLVELKKMLRVTRGAGIDGFVDNILRIECRGPVGEDCEKIVAAVIGSCQELFPQTDVRILAPPKAVRARR